MNTNKALVFLAYWITNSVVLMIVSKILANNVVLGNDKLTLPLAAVLCGLLVTGASYLVPPLVKRSGFKIKEDWLMAVPYLVVNVLVIWIIKKLAVITGLGISNNIFVVLVAVLATVAQWGVYKFVEEKYFKGKK